MNIEDLRLYALSFESATEGFPFGEDTLVFKVQNKIFLLASLTAAPLQFNVKCDPDEAVLLREKYDPVQPGYHMNKNHWNTIIVDGTIPSLELKEFIKNSYDLVSKKKSGK